MCVCACVCEYIIYTHSYKCGNTTLLRSVVGVYRRLKYKNRHKINVIFGEEIKSPHDVLVVFLTASEV